MNEINVAMETGTGKSDTHLEVTKLSFFVATRTNPFLNSSHIKTHFRKKNFSI